MALPRQMAKIFEMSRFFGKKRLLPTGMGRPSWLRQPMATLWPKPWRPALRPEPVPGVAEVPEQAQEGRAEALRRHRSRLPARTDSPQRAEKPEGLS